MKLKHAEHELTLASIEACLNSIRRKIMLFFFAKPVCMSVASVIRGLTAVAFWLNIGWWVRLQSSVSASKQSLKWFIIFSTNPGIVRLKKLNDAVCVIRMCCIASVREVRLQICVLLYTFIEACRQPKSKCTNKYTLLLQLQKLWKVVRSTMCVYYYARRKAGSHVTQRGNPKRIFDELYALQPVCAHIVSVLIFQQYLKLAMVPTMCRSFAMGFGGRHHRNIACASNGAKNFLIWNFLSSCVRRGVRSFLIFPSSLFKFYFSFLLLVFFLPCSFKLSFRIGYTNLNSRSCSLGVFQS